MTILRRREGYRRAFAAFEPAKVARWGPAQIERLLADPGIVRNRRKVEAAVGNARAFLAVTREHGSFDRFLWPFVGGKPRRNRWPDAAVIPAETAESRALSRDLRQRGFSFVGPTICYAFMQAVGLVDDHEARCFRARRR